MQFIRMKGELKSNTFLNDCAGFFVANGLIIQYHQAVVGLHFIHKKCIIKV